MSRTGYKCAIFRLEMRIFEIMVKSKIRQIMTGTEPEGIIVAVGSSGILKGKQELGVTFDSYKLGGIGITKFSKLTICRASEA